MSLPLPQLSWYVRPVGTAAEISAYLDQFGEAGVHRLYLDTASLKRCWAEEGFTAVLKKSVSAAGLEITDLHAPFSSPESLGYPVPEAGSIAVESVKKSILTAAELGAKTVTVHTSRTRMVGDYAPGGVVYPSVDLPRARERIRQQLDKLIPFAEKEGVIIAVENLFLPAGAAGFLNSVMADYNSPCLGYCYDSGHALLLEDQPGKNFADLARWIRLGWEEDTIIPQPEQLDLMLENVVTCHLHDNHGLDDRHLLPGNGVADWKKIVDRLKQAPRLVSVQSEIIAYDTAEVSLAEQIGVFENIGFTL